MSELLDLARSVALEAAELAARRRREGVEVAATKSTVVDVVTEADREVERLVLGRLQDARPQDGVLGEEGASVPSTSGSTWVVDPIDGTVNYLYDIPAYAVSVAAVAGDPRDPAGHQTLAGCVHNPVSGETFTATRGGGAFLDGRRLAVSRQDDLSLALLATGFGYDVARRRRQAEILAALLPVVRDVRRMGSAALDLCQVACARVDAYYERGLNPWDLAAGALVAREAGALVTGLGDAPAGEALVVAAGPTLHPALQAILAPYRPDTDVV